MGCSGRKEQKTGDEAAGAAIDGAVKPKPPAAFGFAASLGNAG